MTSSSFLLVFIIFQSILSKNAQGKAASLEPLSPFLTRYRDGFLMNIIKNEIYQQISTKFTVSNVGTVVTGSEITSEIDIDDRFCVVISIIPREISMFMKDNEYGSYFNLLVLFEISISKVDKIENELVYEFRRFFKLLISLKEERTKSRKNSISFEFDLSTLEFEFEKQAGQDIFAPITSFSVENAIGKGNGELNQF